MSSQNKQASKQQTNKTKLLLFFKTIETGYTQESQDFNIIMKIYIFIAVY